MSDDPGQGDDVGPAWDPPDSSNSHAGSPPPGRKASGRRGLIVFAIAAAAALVVGLVFVADNRNGGDEAVDVTTLVTTDPTEASTPTTTVDPAPETTSTLPPQTTTTTDPGFTQAEGEIFLEPADSDGPDSFTGELFVGESTTSTAPTTTTAPTPEPSGPTTVNAMIGDTPALYGGSKNNAVCDKAGQLLFLEQHPNKAAAFVEALNSDPSLMWSGGSSLTVAQLPDYWTELTPMVLTRDTRVTNHGYRNGRPTSRQVVLQAETAVLTDAYGIPRVRCLCGNPLTQPQPVQATPVYTGARWPDFTPDTIIVVNQTTVVIEIFVLIDISSGDEFIRPAGSDGTDDSLQEASIWRIDMNATQAEVDYFNTSTVSFSGEFTIADDATLSGSGQGTWSFDADCYESSGAIQSTSSAQGTFSVTLTGQAYTTELGRFVAIQPMYGDFAIAAYSGTPPVAGCEQDIYEHVESWIAPSFTTIELQAEGDTVLASYESAGFVGDVTLTPMR